MYGVLRQKQYLDHIIRTYSKHPLRKMKPRTLMTLRIGVFQLLFLGRIPESAAVNATVNTLKSAGQPAWLIDGIRTNRFWILTHEPWKQIMIDRAEALARNGSLFTRFGG